MQRPNGGALRATRALLRVLIALNLGLGVAIAAMLLASLFAESWVFGALGVRPGAGRAALIAGMRLMAVIGIASVPLAHLVLTRLRDVVETVQQGDAFISLNATRLRTIAWTVLGLEALHLGVWAVVTMASSRAQGLDVGWEFSPTRWLAVLLLFVLAQVFEEGTRMREDLEGTV